MWRMARRRTERWEWVTKAFLVSLVSPAQEQPWLPPLLPDAALQPGEDKDEASLQGSFLQTGAKVSDHIPSLCPVLCPY